MFKTIKYLIAGFLVLATGFTAADVHANEPKKAKEVTELVGYDVTEAVVPESIPKDSRFARIDKNMDEHISFNEFQNASQLNNEYAVFSEMDRNNDDKLTYEEFFNYNKTKGKTHIESKLHGKVPVKGTNLVSKAYTEKNYYVPVEPVVVDVQPIEE
jgi:hypothetical protein